MSTIMHASGFINGGRPADVQICSYEGDLRRVVMGVKAKIDHPMRIETVRSLDGELKKVWLYIDVDGTEMWHLFTHPGDQWPGYVPEEPVLSVSQQESGN